MDYLDELKALGMNDELATKAAEFFTAQNSGLLNKRNELLGEIAKLKKSTRAGTEPDSKRLYDLEDELTAIKTDKENLLIELEREKKRNEKTFGDLTAKLSAREMALKTKALEAELSSSVSSAGVDEKYSPAVRAMLEKRAKVVETPEGYSVLASIGGVDKPFGEYVKEWAQSDEAKPFQRAQLNVGGGAAGSNSVGGRDIGKMTATERNKYAMTSPAAKAEVIAYARKGQNK